MAQEVRALELAEELKSLFADDIVEIEEFRKQLTLTIKKEGLKRVLKYLKEERGFNHLQDLCGVDYFGQTPRFSVVYHIYNIEERIGLRLKVFLSEESPEVDTITDLWSGGNWHERECFDMFGIRFKGHPDLRRILMPEDWNGHPLRKDYPLRGKEMWRGFKEICDADFKENK